MIFVVLLFCEYLILKFDVVMFTKSKYLMYNIFKKEAAMLLGLTERSGSTYRRWEPAPFLFYR
jgi:hypothetical protein